MYAHELIMPLLSAGLGAMITIPWNFFCLQDSESEAEEEPKPIVLIDQDSDPKATTVEISFGDRLGALLDTVELSSDLLGFCFES